MSKWPNKAEWIAKPRGRRSIWIDIDSQPLGVNFNEMPPVPGVWLRLIKFATAEATQEIRYVIIILIEESKYALSETM